LEKVSLHIPKSRIDDGDLTEHEIWYLFSRNKLPKHIDRPEKAPGKRGKKVPAAPKAKSIDDQDAPKIERKGGIVDDDEEETYTTDAGWNNDKRRAELSRRGLSLEGGRDDFIARLRRHDMHETLPEDLVAGPEMEDEGDTEDDSDDENDD
jgi:hypothetical protein